MPIDRDNAFYDWQAPTPTTPAELQKTVAKLGRGETLTPTEETTITSTPTTKTEVKTEVKTQDKPIVGKVPAGFTEGPFPKELEQFFGPSSGYAGYKIETLQDKDGNTYYQLSVATGPNSSQTFGAGFTKDPSGKYAPYSPSDKGNGNGKGNDNINQPGQTYTAPDGKIFTDINLYNAYLGKLKADEKALAGKSAYDILYNEFNKYGMASLIEPLKKFIQDGLSQAELTLKLRETPQYQERFAANALRIKNGFAAIDEATYLGLEDKYQSIMQNYGLPASYYERGVLGKQAGFENLIAGNVDPITLEERIMEGQKVLKGSKEIKDAIGQFYPGLNNSDFLAYVLDPKNALAEIKRKVTAAEIGGAQLGAGLEATVANAEALGAAGITGQRYQQAASTIAEASLRGGQLASMYRQDPYTQQTAEQVVLNVPGSAEAAKKTKKLIGLETASFGGKSGAGIIDKERAGLL